MEGRSRKEGKTEDNEVEFLASINHHWLHSEFQRNWQFLLIKHGWIASVSVCRFSGIPVQVHTKLNAVHFGYCPTSFHLIVSGWRLHFIGQESCKLTVIYWSCRIDIYHPLLFSFSIESHPIVVRCHIFEECTLLVPAYSRRTTTSEKRLLFGTDVTKNSARTTGNSLEGLQKSGTLCRVCVLSIRIRGVIIFSVMSLICWKVSLCSIPLTSCRACGSGSNIHLNDTVTVFVWFSLLKLELHSTSWQIQFIFATVQKTKAPVSRRPYFPHHQAENGGRLHVCR